MKKTVQNKIEKEDEIDEIKKNTIFKWIHILRIIKLNKRCNKV